MPDSVRVIVIKDNQLLVMKRDKFGQQFYALIGGEVDPGENAEEALYRELAEETGIKVNNHRLVYEQTGGGFGRQLIYLADYVSGEPKLAADSIEAKLNEQGENVFEPGWLSLNDLTRANLLPTEVKAVLVKAIKAGFPDQPQTIKLATGRL